MMKKRFQLEINYISLVDLLSGALASFVILFISIPHKEHDHRSPSSQEKVIPNAEELEVGQKFEIRNVNFMGNSDMLYPNSLHQIDRLATWMKKNREVILRVEAHANPGGRTVSGKFAKRLMKLSHKRAARVKEALLDRGVSSIRLKFKGFGGKKPLYEDPRTRLEDAKNRRVEFRVISK